MMRWLCLPVLGTELVFIRKATHLNPVALFTASFLFSVFSLHTEIYSLLFLTNSAGVKCCKKTKQGSVGDNLYLSHSQPPLVLYRTANSGPDSLAPDMAHLEEISPIYKLMIRIH